jgi:hypothetical protein
VRLPDSVLTTVKKAGVRVYYADRRQTKLWNGNRDRDEPAFFGGWYWHRVQGGRVVETDEEGPFRTESAAVRDAYVKLQLRMRV